MVKGSCLLPLKTPAQQRTRSENVLNKALKTRRCIPFKKGETNAMHTSASKTDKLFAEYFEMIPYIEAIISNICLRKAQEVEQGFIMLDFGEVEPVPHMFLDVVEFQVRAYVVACQAAISRVSLPPFNDVSLLYVIALNGGVSIPSSKGVRIGTESPALKLGILSTVGHDESGRRNTLMDSLLQHKKANKWQDFEIVMLAIAPSANSEGRFVNKFVTSANRLKSSDGSQFVGKEYRNPPTNSDEYLAMYNELKEIHAQMFQYCGQQLPIPVSVYWNKDAQIFSS
jgi:hypothetical protein